MRSVECRALAVSVGLLAFGVLLAMSGCPKPQPPADTGEVGPAPSPTPTVEKKYKVVISSKPGQWNLNEREKGYRDTFANEYPEIEVITTIDDETKYEVGQKRAADVLAAHPDIDAFAGMNAASGPGVAAAVRAVDKGGDIVIVAMDADTPILDQIDAGVITASVAQRQYFMTYIGVKYLYGLVHGHFRWPGDESKPDLPEIPREIDTGTVEVNKDNVEVFRTPSQGAKEELDEKHPEWRELLSDRDPSEATPDEEYVCIGISTGVEYWNATQEGLNDVSKELRVKGTFTGPLAHNPEEQANTLDQVIARKPAAIMIAPGHPDTLKPYIDKAIDEGIPTICFDTDSPDSKRLAYFGTENYNAGVMGAHILAKALGAKRMGGGEEGTE